MKMLSAFRIVSPRWEATAFSGEGARKHGGRWNSPGLPVVYVGGSRALAALETLVHLTTPASRAKPYRIIEVRIRPEDIGQFDPEPDCRRIGNRWLSECRSLALRVPSALIPEEPNYLLNPNHPGFSRLEFGESAEFRFDPRL